MGLRNTIKRAVCLGLTLTYTAGAQTAHKRAVSNETLPSASINQGSVSGFVDANGNFVYLGIPYAATTGGSNRWSAPQDPPRFQSVFNATAYGPTCPQAVTNPLYTRQDEDCLSVNIWAPSSGENLPVFVYMYGGAMVTGSSSNPVLQGINFPKKDVIMVSLNTRESIYAYPYSSELQGTSQNFGLLDFEKGMEWIHDNIQAFGGDPNHIVIGGHSSGSVHVDHYLWNHPDTWVVGAIEMSANAVSGPAFAPLNVALDVVAAEVGCGTGQGQLACLRNVDILDFQTAYFNSTTNAWFTPAIDNITRFSDYAARFKAGNYPSHVPLITGNSNGEGTIFGLVYSGENTNFSSWINTFDADSANIPDDILLAAYNVSDYTAIPLITAVSLESGAQYGDARFDCAVDYLLDMRSSQQDTWAYRFFGAYDNVIGVADTAPTHGTEIPFFLGGNECFSSLSNVTDAEQALADSINDWFVAWIKNPSAGPGWEMVNPVSGPLIKLGIPGNEEALLNATTGDYNGRCQSVYKPYFPKYPVVQNPVTLGS